MIVLAHAGHWAVQLLYLLPLVLLVGILVTTKVRDRRAARTGRDAQP